MPIYEYRCVNGHVTEAFQRFSDPPLEICETCSAALQKVLSAPALHFKGSGFYTTDYGRGKGARTDGEGAKSTNGDGGGSSTSTASDKVGSSSSSTSSGASSSGGSSSSSSTSKSDS